MEFAFGQTLYRFRFPALAVDPYNPSRPAPDLTANPDVLTLPGGFVGSSSTVRGVDGVRSQTISEKSLYLTDTTLDVVNGDRIGATNDPALAEYQVDGETAADVNPFTGWQPVREVPLKKVTG